MPFNQFDYVFQIVNNENSAGVYSTIVIEPFESTH